jgi:signal transduction histidine kinase
MNTSCDEHLMRQLGFLERIVRATAESSDHEDLLRSIINQATVATGTQVCSLYLWDSVEQLLTLTATNGLAQSGVGQVRLGLGEGVTGWVAATRRPLAVPDVRAEPRFTWVPNLDQERFRSMLSVPILSQDRVIGVMNVQTVDVHRFSPAEIEFVQTIAAGAAGIIELSGLRQKLGRQLELERAAVEQLTALNAGKSDLLAMLSHDFRGPLAVAKTYVYGLMDRLQGGDRETCCEIDAELEGLERLTDNLMLSLELEAQHAFVLDLEQMDMVELTSEVCRGFKRTTPTHDIVCESSESACWLSADRPKIRSVLVNLVGNAIKYSPRGGRIRTTVRGYADHVEVAVVDQGIGLAARQVESIFERYGRGETALQHGIRGHGLGLFLCKRIVEAHSGTIYARPLERGSHFAFTLPAALIQPSAG